MATRRFSIMSALLLLGGAVVNPALVHAQVHFTECVSLTGSNAHIVIPAAIAPEIDGGALAEGDEVAVYTEDGTCAGVLTWAGRNAAITVWGDDPFTEEKEGFTWNEPLAFRMWDASSGLEYGGASGTVTATLSTARAYYNTEAVYAEDGLYVLASLSAASADPALDPRAPQAKADASLPNAIELEQNYPNPFNPSTSISYYLAEEADVQLAVFDIQGRRVALLASGSHPAGRHEVQFDGTDLPSGMYFYRLAAGNAQQMRRMLLAK